MITMPSSTAERPEHSPVFLWAIQQQLLQEAEARLGPKDHAKKIYQPTFSDLGPRIINTPEGDGAFADLSRNAAGYWPTAVYELAHETVHLLDPVPGNTNVLEEGIAETFALEMATLIGGKISKSSLPSYVDACHAVKRLTSDIYGVGRRVREKCGALSRASHADLSLVCPGAAPDLLEKLASGFKRE